MTESSFLSWYPQFTSFTPAAVLRETVSRAGGLFSGMEPEDVEEARRLYTAHRLTLYELTRPEEGNSTARAAAEAGKSALQKVSSRKVGDVTVAYALSTAAAQAAGLADLAETAYGVQLLGLLRLYTGTRYVP